MLFVDSHCHLNLDPLSADIDKIVEAARSQRVEYLQTICTKLSDIEELISIAEKYDNVFSSVGIHPNENFSELSKELLAEKLITYSKHPKIIGFGETGLDYYQNVTPKEIQHNNFIAHIIAAQETALPVIIHARDAEEDIVNILKQQMDKKPFPGLIHCFTGSEDFANAVLELGFYISFSGIVTFNNAKNLQEIASKIPLDRILIETDSPYLAPQPFRGKSNQPAYVVHVAEKLANLHNVDIETIASHSTDNFFRIFNKAKRPNKINVA